jgi:hypothetical protein
MTKLLTYILTMLLCYAQSFKVEDLFFRKTEVGEIEYHPTCIQKVAWWYPDGKGVGGDVSFSRDSFSSSFTKKRVGLGIATSNVPPEQIPEVAFSEGGILTLNFRDGTQEKIDVTIGLDTAGRTTLDVAKKLLEQTEDVPIKVEGDWGSYEQVIPVEVIKEFSEFYSQCLQ